MARETEAGCIDLLYPLANHWIVIRSPYPDPAFAGLLPLNQFHNATVFEQRRYISEPKHLTRQNPVN